MLCIPRGRDDSLLYAATAARGPVDEDQDRCALGWSGRYTVRVLVMRPGAAKPIEASFALNRVF